jgi:preprotein translocase subunit SecB
MLAMNIREIRLDSVAFHVNRDFKQPVGGEGFSYGLKMEHDLDDTSRVLAVRLWVKTPEKEASSNYPFHFEVTLQGVFEFSEPIHEEVRRHCATIECPTILFPYLRETLADLTRRAGFPPLHLQATNFAEFAQQNAGQEESAPVETESPPEKKPRRPSRALKSAKPETP